MRGEKCKTMVRYHCGALCMMILQRVTVFQAVELLLSKWPHYVIHSLDG